MPEFTLIFPVKVYYISTGDPIKDIDLKMKRLVKEASIRETSLKRRLEIRKELTQLRKQKRCLLSTQN